VAYVVRAALGSGLFEDVLVVDDGSRDRTSDEARRAGARVLRLEHNGGKAGAVRAGIAATTAPVVCLLDADLLDVTDGHLRCLVEPVVGGAVPAQLAVFTGGRKATTLAQKVAPLISGQRCLRRDLLAGLEDWGRGFGIETALNLHLKKQGIEQRKVEWEGAAQVMKEEKRGLRHGLTSRVHMYRDIVRTWVRIKKQDVQDAWEEGLGSAQRD
jgi:glycosyltransferase involved in cell wall biosynthesis